MMKIRVVRNQDNNIMGIVIVSLSPDKDQAILTTIYESLLTMAKKNFSFTLSDKKKNRNGIKT